MTPWKAITGTMENFWLVHPFAMYLPNRREVAGLAVFADARRRCLAIEVFPLDRRKPYIEFLKQNVARYGVPATLIVDRSPEATSIAVRHWAAVNRTCICFECTSRGHDNPRVRQTLRSLAAYLSTKSGISDLGSLNRTIQSWRRSR